MEEVLHQVIISVWDQLNIRAKLLEMRSLACYLVVQKGLSIGFFVFHPSENDTLSHFGIDNIGCCTSLTQKYWGRQAVLVPPDGVKPFYAEQEKGKGGHSSLENVNKLREQAENYFCPCIFNFEKH